MKKRQLVGIINCTPDSYFEKGRFTNTQAAIEYGLQILSEGADVLDIGGESTRPGSMCISEDEEIKRVIPVIEGIRKHSSCTLSVDTYKPCVAEAALEAGANWINDITALQDPLMLKLAVVKKPTCCLTHMYAKPHSHPNPHYPEGMIHSILSFFQKRVASLMGAGVEPSKIILDPGIGGGAFGKSVDENLKIIKNMGEFTALGYPILVGLSRKSFQQKILQKLPSEVLSTTLSLNTMALLGGVSYIRVHDVAEHRDILTLFERLEP